MKSNKEIARNMMRQEESSDEQNSDKYEQQPSQLEQSKGQVIQPSEFIQDQISSSQQKSSDILVSQLIYDPEVGYKTGHYKIQKIKFRRWNLQKRRFEYLIKWKGYNDNQCTWQTTQDIIGEPCLQLKDLGKNTLLPNFQRTHAKTFIYDEEKNKNIKEYHQTRKNHLKYAPKQLIQEMDQQMQELYGEKIQQNQANQKLQIKQQTNSEPAVKLQTQNFIEKQKKLVNPPYQSFEVLKGYRVKNITIQKLLYYPLQFELKILIRSNTDFESKRLLTCSEIMKIDPQTGIFCYKAKLAMIEKWKKQNLIKTSVKS